MLNRFISTEAKKAHRTVRPSRRRLCHSGLLPPGMTDRISERAAEKTPHRKPQKSGASLSKCPAKPPAASEDRHAATTENRKTFFTGSSAFFTMKLTISNKSIAEICPQTAQIPAIFNVFKRITAFYENAIFYAVK